MAVRIILDTIENARFRDGLNGFQIIRPFIATDIPMAPGDSGAEIWAKVLASPDLPIGLSLLSPSYPVYLQFREMVGINRFKRTVAGQLIYGSPPHQTDGTINFSLTDQYVTNHIQTFCTADGSKNIFAWYKPGGSTSPTTSTALPAGAKPYHAPAHKIVTYRVIRAVGFATRSTWISLKGDLRAAAGSINGVPWGTEPIGNWLFLGPLTRTQDRGNSFSVQLDFISEPAGFGFYPLLFYYDIMGRHPTDSATESEIRAITPPVNGLTMANGATVASIYREVNWPTLLAFNPDDT